MKELKLIKHYQNLLRDLNMMITTINEPEEYSTKVYTSEWITIFLIGDVTSKKISIQVEISYSDFPHLEEDSKITLRQILENQIISLKYLSRLHDKGFILGVVAEESIWFATKTLENEPTEELRKSIIPP